MTALPGAEPGSFRDPGSRVFVHEGRVLRALDERAEQQWQAVSGSGFFQAALAAGTIVGTEPAAPGDVPLPGGSEWVAALRHERIPFVSYPYEWSFSMLRDAALLQLDLLDAALAEDFVAKDATPYNIGWRGSVPTFLDVGSWERLEPGEPWVGYRQFGQLFLFPLMLRAYKGVPYQPWLRGDLEGIPAPVMRRLLTRRDLVRRGVLVHVALQARAEQRYAATDRDIRAEMRGAGFRKELIQANVRKLRKTVAALEWGATASEWSGYASCEHVATDRTAKTRFVQQVAGARRWPLVWDLGANDGHFSQVAADAADYVLAIDADELATDRLYRDLAARGETRIHPLLADLANPPPSQGWLGAERRDLLARGQPDLVLALAVMHHLVIGRNIPLRQFVGWLARLGAPCVLEFAHPEDPLVERLTRNKRSGDVHRDYSEAALTSALEDAFAIRARERLPSGTRTLLHVEPRA